MKKNNHHKNKKNHRNHLSTEDVKDMLSRLEDQYRKANISEKDYKVMKEKYSRRLGLNNMAKKEVKKEEEIEEITPEVIERLATQLSQQDQTKENEEKAEKEKKGGFFGKLFGKKKEKVEETEKKEAQTAPAPEHTQAVEQKPEPQTYEEPESYPEPKSHVSETSKKVEILEVEIEKLKTILETIREGGHVTEETIQTISEGIGELRSLVFQTDASLKETMVKMEKIEDDVSEVQPKEIVKKFREIDAQFEKYNIETEKFQTKLEDANEKLNKMYEIIKSIGGIENLVDINKKIQEKIKDVDEAVKYIGRIGAKTEKQFMDLSRGLEDLVMFKAKQEDLDESLKEILKSIDGLNVKFEGYVSKKDNDVFREDIMLLQKQLENVNKVLPLVDVKLPQEIIDLRREKDDILLLLDSLQEQYNTKKITKVEYTNFKEGNEKRLKEIDKQLEKEWKKVERLTKPSGKEKPVEQQAESINEESQTREEVKKEEKPKPEETKAEEKTEEKEKEEVKEKMKEVKELFEKKKETFVEKVEETEKKETQTAPAPEPEVTEEKPKEIIKKKNQVKEVSEKAEEKEVKSKPMPKPKIKKVKKIDKNKKPKPVTKETGRIKILNDIKKMKI